MICPTFYLLQLVVQFILKNLILICLQLLETLVFFEGWDVLSQLINESSSPVLDKVVYSYKHVEVSTGLFYIVLKDSNPLDCNLYYLLERLEVICKIS